MAEEVRVDDHDSCQKTTAGLAGTQSEGDAAREVLGGGEKGQKSRSKVLKVKSVLVEVNEG